MAGTKTVWTKHGREDISVDAYWAAVLAEVEVTLEEGRANTPAVMTMLDEAIAVVSASGPDEVVEKLFAVRRALQSLRDTAQSLVTKGPAGRTDAAHKAASTRS